MSEKRKFINGLITGLFLSVIIMGATYAGREAVEVWKAHNGGGEPAQEEEVVNARTMQKLQLIEDIIEEHYALEMVDSKTMENGIYEGLINSLDDPYSAYFSAEEMQEQQEKMDGVYYGIGAYVKYDSEMGFARLGEIFADSPALESGLQEGDLIVKVDGQYTKDMGLDEVVALIKGEEGTKVVLTIMREGETEAREIEVERREVPKQTVTYEMLRDKIAYIRITEFDKVTVDQFTDALATAKGAGMLGLVLDLRDNPGGNLAAVIDVARRILPKGLVVYTEDKAGERQDYNCDGENELTVPMVVLVNGGSASASEVLAGAIKDYDKGKLLGTTTFGKGIVQKYLGLSDGSAVKLTTSKYYTPKGNNIHEIGIEPDEELEMDYEQYLESGYDNQLERAVEILTTGE
ncbi:S41 family peptidase [Lachnospiraceae bacterium JLR.KK008]